VDELEMTGEKDRLVDMEVDAAIGYLPVDVSGPSERPNARLLRLRSMNAALATARAAATDPTSLAITPLDGP
jgi:hypothetical protein